MEKGFDSVLEEDLCLSEMTLKAWRVLFTNVHICARRRGLATSHCEGLETVEWVSGVKSCATSVPDLMLANIELVDKRKCGGRVSWCCGEMVAWGGGSLIS